MRQIYWILKLSKLCNLRCGYCYEWNELGDATRMSEAVLTNVFRLAREYHFREMRRLGTVPQTVFVWHGGEPFAQPLSYLERVQELKRAAIGEQAKQPRYFSDVIQTNLYKLSPEIMRFLREHHMDVGISLDVVPGVRRSLAGGHTEGRVSQNLDALRAEGFKPGAVAVLARHTAPRVRDVYDYFAERSMSLRVLPLFDGPGERPFGLFGIEEPALVEAMCGLFDHWLARDCKTPLLPFAVWMRPVIRKLLGVSVAPYDRSEGERYLLVNTDGKVYPSGDGYGDDARLGDLGAPLDWAGFTSTPTYARSLARDAEHRRATCGGCAFEGACDSYPAFESNYASRKAPRCAIAYEVMGHIERSLLAHGFDREALSGLLREHLDGATTPPV